MSVRNYERDHAGARDPRGRDIKRRPVETILSDQAGAATHARDLAVVTARFGLRSSRRSSGRAAARQQVSVVFVGRRQLRRPKPCLGRAPTRPCSARSSRNRGRSAPPWRRSRGCARRPEREGAWVGRRCSRPARVADHHRVADAGATWSEVASSRRLLLRSSRRSSRGGRCGSAPWSSRGRRLVRVRRVTARGSAVRRQPRLPRSGPERVRRRFG